MESCIFQDDSVKLTANVEGVMKGNVIMEAAMKRKQLSLNISKCSVVFFGKGRKIRETREKINNSGILKLCEEPLKVKNRLEYLGEILHEEGISKSSEETVKKRSGKVLQMTYEIAAFMKDYRVNCVGSVQSGLDIYEMSVIPFLLSSSDTWYSLNKSTINSVENLQLKMFRCLFATPDSTPKPILRFDLGSLSILEKIHIRKLTFLHFLLSSSDENLSKQILTLQIQYGFLGLASEGRELLSFYDLPNIIDDQTLCHTKHLWKKIVHEAVRQKSEETIKKEFLSYSKLKSLTYQEEAFELKPYIKNMKLEDARTHFRIRSSTLPFKMNMKSKYQNETWKCDSCLTSQETSSHVIWCPGLAPLREGLRLDSDVDICRYFQSVLRFRQEVKEKTQ